ncbi:glycine cleavage system protein GcvH [Amycolatopsis sp. NPDC004368]
MPEVDPEVKYTAQHQWLRLLENGSGRVGITDFAQESLGDVLTVTLPGVGDRVVAGKPFGEIESPKSVSEVYAPISGVISSVNSLLVDSPEIINDDPYDEGWLVTLDIDPNVENVGSEGTGLMTAEEYQRFTDS